MRKISFVDVTLRECSRCGIALTFKEKIEIAKLLDEVRADVVETPPITDGKLDSLFLRTISPLLKNSVLSCPAGFSLEEVENAARAVSGARKPRLLVSLPVSITQMEYALHKKPGEILELVALLTSRCASLCREVEFSAGDAFGAEPEYLRRAVETAVDNGAKVISVSDAEGSALPEEFASLIGGLYSAVPKLAGATLGAECGNALDMANACVFSAVKAGATQIKACAHGKFSPSLKSAVRAVTLKGHVLGAYCGVDSTRIIRATNKIRSIADYISKKETSFDNVLEAPSARVLLDDAADASKVDQAASVLGYELSPEDSGKVFEAFKRISVKKQVGAKELEAIIASVSRQVPPTYKLQSYVINTGNVISSTANIVLEKGARTLRAVHMGDGPIDAAFLAIEQIIGRHYELDDFQIQAVTEGREAAGEALVKLRSSGKLYSGRGISTDIVGASVIAYINALNKIVYEERAL